MAGSGVGREEHRHQRQSRGGHRKRLGEAAAELAVDRGLGSSRLQTPHRCGGGKGLLGGRREHRVLPALRPGERSGAAATRVGTWCRAWPPAGCAPDKRFSHRRTEVALSSMSAPSRCHDLSPLRGDSAVL